MVSKYIILVILSLFVLIFSNITVRYQKNCKIGSNKYINNSKLKWLLIIPTNKKILKTPFINYCIQLFLFIITIIFFIVNVINNTTILLDNFWTYIIYILLSIIPLSLSGSLNKWNY